MAFEEEELRRGIVELFEEARERLVLRAAIDYGTFKSGYTTFRRVAVRERPVGFALLACPLCGSNTVFHNCPVIPQPVPRVLCSPYKLPPRRPRVYRPPPPRVHVPRCPDCGSTAQLHEPRHCPGYATRRADTG